MRRRRMWCRSGLWQQSRDGLPPPRASPWYCVTLYTLNPVHIFSYSVHSVIYTAGHHIFNLSPPFAVSNTIGILKMIETSDSSIECFRRARHQFIGVNSRCLGKTVQNSDVLFIWKLFSIFFTSSWQQCCLFSSHIGKGALCLKINRLCKS